ncbi:MAG: FIST C-terminal domain-containing protein [Candidatus Cloacimonetes bacterium]|nr:FIST C-terminal domain-containing protein [Candidatus Cloacimonadota bacterium]
MIKTFTVQTTELDDEQLAIEEIKSQLNITDGLKKNTIGIIACHYEFILSGIFKAVCEALPFEIIGTIASAQSIPDKTDLLLMTLMVMTSDDVEFDRVITESLASEKAYQEVVAESYKSVCRKDENPALILAFAPFILQNCGDDYVNTISEVSGGIPCFGTLAVDDTLNFENTFMLANGEYYSDKMAMILIYGNIQPKFFVANISDEKIMGKGAIITKSMGSIIMEVNERHIIEYFEELGLAEASETQYAMSNLPFLLDYNDGTPKVSKIFVMLTEDKHAICAGAMPQGSTMYMAKSDAQDVMLTTGITVDTILKEIDNASVLLIYSCIARSMALGGEQFKEMELINQRIGNKIPFLMANSGGEICPTMISDKKAINRFHNNAFIACMF